MNNSDDSYAKEFGLKVMDQLTLLDARVLPAPRVNVFLLFEYERTSIF
jgi:hypothetical protein